MKSADFLGNVRVDYDELDMTADRLTLALLEELPNGAKREDDKLAVESLSAIGNVRADVKSENVKVYADRLFADPAKDQLELFGTPASDTAPATFARVVRPDATLAGEHLVMNETGGTVDVPGPGSFDFLPDADNPGKTVHITWATSMHYDDLAGQAKFLGDVKTLSTDGTDTNELMGDDLVLTFVKDDSTDAKADAASVSGGGAAGRRLATAVMNSNVRFRARSYATAERKDLVTELFLIGPRMEFNDPGLSAPAGPDEALQQVQVIGTGRMLITDMRPKDENEATAKPANGSNPASIDIAGRGRTAFEWSDRLILDLTHGEMLMKGAVAMVHQPEEGERVQLDCQDLAAELKKPRDKKKSSGWLSEDAPKPELSRVWADHGIRILHGPATVTCDHLLYEEDKREIILWSDEPNVVTFESEGEPTPAKSSAFKWHRDTGRVEAFKLRTGTIPLRRSEREKN
ncbi:MAG: LptA/OstA family protein [Phycisphaerales bacterium]